MFCILATQLATLSGSNVADITHITRQVGADTKLLRRLRRIAAITLRPLKHGPLEQGNDLVHPLQDFLGVAHSWSFPFAMSCMVAIPNPVAARILS